MASREISLASIGLGWWGSRLAKAAVSTGRFKIAAAFARHPDAREEFCRVHGGLPASNLDEIWDNTTVDAVVLATPHSTHLDLIKSAAQAGKHIFIEKPLTLTVADGRRAEAAASEAGVVLQVGHNKRRQPAYRRIKRSIDDGELGLVHLATGLTTKPADQMPRPGWRSNPEECPAGGMTALGIHMVDTMCYLLGPVARVQVFTQRLWRASDLDDITAVNLEFASGALGQLSTSVVLPTRSALMVMGTSATMWNEDDGRRLFLQSLTDDGRHEVPVETIDTLQDELDEFANCIEGAKEPETGAGAALSAVAVLEAVVSSARTGKAIDVEQC